MNQTVVDQGGGGLAPEMAVLKVGDPVLLSYLGTLAQGLGVGVADVVEVLLLDSAARLTVEEELFGAALSMPWLVDKQGVLAKGSALFRELVSQYAKTLVRLAAQPGNVAAQSAQGAGGRVVVGAS